MSQGVEDTDWTGQMGAQSSLKPLPTGRRYRTGLGTSSAAQAEKEGGETRGQRGETGLTLSNMAATSYKWLFTFK